MDKNFLINERVYTYQDLLERINKKEKLSNFVYSEELFEVYVQIIKLLLSGYSPVLFDGNFSKNEFLEYSKTLEQIEINSDFEFENIDEYKTAILNTFKKTNLGMTLFTSGTTGVPKKLYQSLLNLARNVKIYPFHQCWGLCYNPTHMAGVQVLLQVIYNFSTIVDLRNSNRYTLLQEYNVTNTSMTPTFFKINFFDSQELSSFKTVTFGGEKVSQNILEKAEKVFPEAKIRNIYASTEAGSLFVAEGEYFVVLDSMKEKILFKDSKLYIHESILADGLGNVEWYDTGDIVEFLNGDESRFRFVSRDSDIINVGGYNVNPNEVESIISSSELVKDCIVYSIDNSVLGKVLAVDIILTDNSIENPKKYIKKYISDNLQEWKRPMKIKFVEQISLTRTGKKTRR
ncbi:AMP-binding protein [Halobacteriovorax sp. RT-2-6]|uniref:AMP-binding protein n=1 Tax=unclassified Halobacteriovorax TaxID=2639665 RepID=UPI00399BBFF4